MKPTSSSWPRGHRHGDIEEAHKEANASHEAVPDIGARGRTIGGVLHQAIGLSPGYGDD
jgi:hypothetical protein